MSLSLVLINFERLHSGFFSLWKSFLGLETAVNHEHVVTVGETCVSGCVVWIDSNRLVEEVNSLLQLGRGSFVPRVTTLQVETIGFELFLLLNVQLQTEVFEDVA